MRRRHGARPARMRGRPRISADLDLLAPAVNIARLAGLEIRLGPEPRRATITA